jgi:hypothetical protein
MLTPEYLAVFTDGYLGMVDVLNEQIVRDISRRMMKTGKITGTAKWQIRQAQQSGKLLDDIVKDIGKFTNYSDEKIRSMFKEAGIISINNDASPLVKAGIVKKATLSQNMSELLIANARKTVGDVNNLTLTTASKSQQMFIQSLNEAMLQVQSGAFSYQEALKQAIKKAAQSGGKVLYSSGSQMSLDAAMRMALLTGVNQTAASLTELYASDMDVEYYETSAHAGARPSHTVWQGRIFKIDGSTSEYPNFADSTGYGTVGGLCGANCRHSFHPYWPGISEPAYTKNMLQDYNIPKHEYNGKLLTEYESDQLMRQMERSIRESKRTLVGYDSAMQNAQDVETENSMKEAFQEEAVKLKEKEKKLKDFCSKTGKKQDTARTQVYAVKDDYGNVVGYGRSTSMKAVWANRKAKK